MEQTDTVKTFCEVCSKEKDPKLCKIVDGKTVCCEECEKLLAQNKAAKKPAICEFC